MITYTKRNGMYIYEQIKSESLVRILEVVFSKKIAFWLFVCLNESILPLNFFSHDLYPKALVNYALRLVQHYDDQFCKKFGQGIQKFFESSFSSLFATLEIED
jgi:hypothetical protein